MNNIIYLILSARNSCQNIVDNAVRKIFVNVFIL